MAELTYTGIEIEGVSHTRLRYSARARRMRIEVRPDRSLLIVVPSETREDQWLPFVLGRRKWIRNALDRFPVEALDPESLQHLPDRIELVCTNDSWMLEHRVGTQNRVTVSGGRLLLSTREASPEQARQTLRRWLMQQARSEFSLRLETHSASTGLGYGKLSIRGQKTRWGSCSAKGNISLNYKLLFMPVELVDHVILHELTHTRHLNHSASFWDLLEQHDPNTRQHRKALRRAGRELPGWLANL
jgi:predicted metal-dependent hydrolase